MGENTVITYSTLRDCIVSGNFPNYYVPPGANHKSAFTPESRTPPVTTAAGLRPETTAAAASSGFISRFQI